MGEKKEEIRAKQEERAENEGREKVSDEFHKGKLIKRNRSCGWIKLLQPSKLPEEVRNKIKEMTKDMRAKAVERGRGDDFTNGAIYVRMSDAVDGVKLEPDMQVKFKVYMDEKGVGALEVQEA